MSKTERSCSNSSSDLGKKQRHPTCLVYMQHTKTPPAIERIMVKSRTEPIMPKIQNYIDQVLFAYGEASGTEHEDTSDSKNLLFRIHHLKLHQNFVAVLFNPEQSLIFADAYVVFVTLTILLAWSFQTLLITSFLTFPKSRLAQPIIMPSLDVAGWGSRLSTTSILAFKLINQAYKSKLLQKLYRIPFLTLLHDCRYAVPSQSLGWKLNLLRLF